jgi:hypothetical protein
MKPDRQAMEVKLKSPPPLEYDLDEFRVDIPENYTNELNFYTGHNWDVWGLTRMQPGLKWHLAYSRAGVETPGKALSKLQDIFLNLNNSNLTFIKDPRLIYLLPLIDVQVPVVIIKRNPLQILRSMRNHYGPNLFTEQIIHSDWVSNHFNYRVQPQDFEEYLDVYGAFEKYAVDNFDVAFIEYEKMYDVEELNQLSLSIGHPLKWKK